MGCGFNQVCEKATLIEREFGDFGARLHGGKNDSLFIASFILFLHRDW